MRTARPSGARSPHGGRSDRQGLESPVSPGFRHPARVAADAGTDPRVASGRCNGEAVAAERFCVVLCPGSRDAPAVRVPTRYATIHLPGQVMNPRIVIFEEEQRQLEGVCKKLAKDSLARAIFLLDKNGQIIVATGEVAEIDTTSLASLVAGTAAATSSLARLLGEEEFPVHFHEGQRDNLHISIVGPEHILAVIFDQRSSLGLVRLRVKKASDQLLEIFVKLADRQSEDQGNNVFSEITDEDIDNLFSDSF